MGADLVAEDKIVVVGEVLAALELRQAVGRPPGPKTTGPHARSTSGVVFWLVGRPPMICAASVGFMPEVALVEDLSSPRLDKTADAVGKRHRRIRARSATGHVAGAATKKARAQAPIVQEPARPTSVLPESPRPGHPTPIAETRTTGPPSAKLMPNRRRTRDRIRSRHTRSRRPGPQVNGIAPSARLPRPPRSSHRRTRPRRRRAAIRARAPARSAPPLWRGPRPRAPSAPARWPGSRR